MEAFDSLFALSLLLFFFLFYS